MKYQTYLDTSSQWRWRLLAGNYKIVAISGEGYINLADCLHAINLVKGSAVAPIE